MKKDKRNLQDGYVFYRAWDNRYEARYKDGKKRVSIYAQTEEECQQRLDEAVKTRDKFKTALKLYAWLDEWYKVFKKPNVKESQANQIEVTIRLHIKKGLENKPLAEINGLDLQRYLMSLPNTRTRESIIDTLNMSFEKAYGIGLIDRNPMLAVEVPRYRRKKGKALEEDMLFRFLEVIKEIDSNLRDYYMFVLLTGARRSEALGVTPADLDFEESLIHIRGTKNATSDRYVPMFDDLKELLQNMDLSKKYLFDFTANYVSKQFKKLCDKNGIGYYREENGKEVFTNHKLHELRHTFATVCYESGVKTKAYSGWLGHSKVSTTEDIYTHERGKHSHAEAEKLKNRYKKA